jgi:hypothetical protein
MDIQNMSTQALCGLAADLRGLVSTYYNGGTNGDAHQAYSHQLGEVKAELQRRHPGVPALSL